METNAPQILTNTVERVGTLSISPDLRAKLISSVVILLVALLLFFGLKRIFQLLMKRANLPTLMFKPFRLTLRYGVLIVAIALVLDAWGVETQTLLAVLGTVLGLVAIGFVAVWSVLSNFLCTFVLILFKPFNVGDDVEIPADSVKGRVVDLTLIYTTLRVGEDEFVQIPNNTFFQKIFKRRVGREGISLEDQLRQAKPAK